MALCELRQGKRAAGAPGRSKGAADAPADTSAAGLAAPGGPQGRSREASEGGAGVDADGPHGKENQPQPGDGGKAGSGTAGATRTAAPSAAQGITCPLAAATAAVAGSAAAGPLQRRNRNRNRGGRHGSAYAMAGVTLGKGVTMACFCLRHEELVLHRHEFKPSYPGGRFAERRADLTREQLRARRDALLAAEKAVAAEAAAQAVQQTEQEQQQLTRQSVETGRSMSFADWRSRGHRAPEAVAIAREKRSFVRQLPYLVTGRLQHSEEQVRALAPIAIGAKPTSCPRPTGSARARPDGHVEPEASSLQPIAGLPRQDAEATASMLPVSTQTPVSGAVVGGCKAAAEAEDSGPSAEAVEHLPLELLAAATASGARSVAERYWAMRATVSVRLAAGKSAIHGWGAFAKVPHKRGEPHSVEPRETDQRLANYLGRH